MEAEPTAFLELVLSHLPPRDWAPACAAFLLGFRRADAPREQLAEDERRSTFEFFESIINTRALRDDPTGCKTFELTSRRLKRESELSRLPPNLSRFPQSSVAIPAASERNGAFAVDSASEARQALEIPVDDPSLRELAGAVELYESDLQRENVASIRGPRREPERAIICGVQPYIDTVMATLALYLVSDIVKTPLIFRPVDWIEVPEYASKHRIHISYGSRSAFSPSQFEFKATKKNVTRIPCVRNVDQKGGEVGGATMPPALNFVGYYTPSSSRFGRDFVRLRFNPDVGSWVDVTAFAVPSVHDFEANAILAVAAGVLPVSYLILTNAGFLWAAEAGLLYRDLGNGLRLGSLEWGEVLADDSQDDVVGFAVRRSNAQAVSQNLVHRLANVVERIDSALDTKREEGGGAKALLSALKGPIALAYQYDSGILARLSPRMAVEMTRSRGSHFEREVDFRPEWWGTLAAGWQDALTPRGSIEGREA